MTGVLLSGCQSPSLDGALVSEKRTSQLNTSLSKNPETRSGYFNIRHDFSDEVLGQCRFKVDYALFVGTQRKHVWLKDTSVTEEDAGLFRLFAKPEFKCNKDAYFNGTGEVRYVYTATVDGERKARFNSVEGEVVDGRFINAVWAESSDKEWGKSGWSREVNNYLQLNLYDPIAGSVTTGLSSDDAAKIGNSGDGASWHDNLRAREAQLMLNSQLLFAKWFNTTSDLNLIEGSQKSNVVETALVSGRSASAGAMIDYSVTANQLGLANLTAENYVLDIEFLVEFHIKLENAGFLGAMVSFSNRKAVKVSINLNKSTGYSASGSVPLGQVDLGGDKGVLISGARDKLEGYNIVTHIQGLK